ncbi:glucose inhibited division protein [Cyclospora cayetanensis]|uniref:Glucose inhibited division protein n=1 Tax=Cyclospora cayetanensis TaxID=88456 RepID=A0A1D3CU49_9EIME|nr:glucose inhibited division protein [Cyclospora cayetanensis]
MDVRSNRLQSHQGSPGKDSPPPPPHNVLPPAGELYTHVQEPLSSSLLPFDVAVLGGGHAGVEAAVAASRLGLRVALISPGGMASVGVLSCNPSIGGSGKSHLVCEVDACGGLLGRAADIAAVHWRVLNVSRGPAAWAPRVQLDRRRFAGCMRRFLRAFQPSLTVVDAVAEDVLTETTGQQPQDTAQGGWLQQRRQQRVCGVRLKGGAELEASAVVVAAGTFLDAVVAVGSSRAEGGRMHSRAEAAVAENAAALQKPMQRARHHQQPLPDAICDVEPAAKCLAASLQRLGLHMTHFKTGRLPGIKRAEWRSCEALGRLQLWVPLAVLAASSESFLLYGADTPAAICNRACCYCCCAGTPARLLGTSIDFSRLQRQPSDPTPRPFSGAHTPEQLRRRREAWIECYIGRTTDQTKKIVLEHLKSLPVHLGDDGQGVGPRYCPSIANKASNIRQFPNNSSHVIWLEPEDPQMTVVYPGGLSGAFPPAVQQQLLQSITGLEAAQMLRVAYDVEYLVVQGTDVKEALEAKAVQGLFLAGQVLGTTGYEEAAALGLLAGWNAGLFARAQKARFRKAPYSDISHTATPALAAASADERGGGAVGSAYAATLPNSSSAETAACPPPASSSRLKHSKLVECQSTHTAASSLNLGTTASSVASPCLPECVVLDSRASMAGALAEQLTSRNATEPLRAFAARVPSRLSVRCDNAAERLLPRVLHGGLLPQHHPKVTRARKKMENVQRLVDLIRNFELPATQWASRVSEAIAALRRKVQLSQLGASAASAAAAADTVTLTGAAAKAAQAGEEETLVAPQRGPLTSAAPLPAEGAAVSRAVHAERIKAPASLLLLGLESWQLAVGKGHRRWTAAQLLAGLPPALAKLEQPNTSCRSTALPEASQEGHRVDANEQNAAQRKPPSSTSPTIDGFSERPISALGGPQEHPHLGRDCVALQLLVSLMLDELMGSKGNAASSSLAFGGLERVPERADGGEEANAAVLLLQQCLCPSFGSSIASSVYAEVRYSFYFRREEREAEAAQSDHPIPEDLGREQYPFLCLEEIDCLRRYRPRTFREAARLGCLRPASLLQLIRRSRSKRATFAAKATAAVDGEACADAGLAAAAKTSGA